MTGTNAPTPMDETPDPYAGASLHGLWPLAAAPATEAGVRFADLGADAPGDCLGVAGLPDFEISLRTFANDVQRRAWIAAAREFGGNAIAFVEGPDVPNRALRFALVVRLDRDGPRGAASLDAAIPLVRDQERDGPGTTADLGAWGAEARAGTLSRHATGRRHAAWREAWAAEIAVLLASRALKPGGDPGDAGDHLPLRLADDRSAGRLHRSGGALRARLDLRIPDKVGPELRERVARAAAARGWALLPDGAAERALPRLDAALAARIAEDAAALLADVAAAAGIEAARTTLIALHIDPEALRVLRRLGQGLPVASQRYRDPGAQLNPRTGKAVTVAASRVERLFLAGVITPVWWKEPGGKRRDTALPVAPLDWNAPILWGLTETGRTLVAGEIEAAAETQVADAATALAWTRGRPQPGGRIPREHAGLSAAMAALPTPSEATVEAIEQALDRERLSAWFPAGADRAALVGAAMAAGLVESDGKTLARIPRAAAPAP